tara:strand:+ start:59 stop:394 length:336 start_codon:yes stop_codon:yes gene_type:complete
MLEEIKKLESIEKYHINRHMDLGYDSYSLAKGDTIILQCEYLREIIEYLSRNIMGYLISNIITDEFEGNLIVKTSTKMVSINDVHITIVDNSKRIIPIIKKYNTMDKKEIA